MEALREVFGFLFAPFLFFIFIIFSRYIFRHKIYFFVSCKAQGVGKKIKLFLRCSKVPEVGEIFSYPVHFGGFKTFVELRITKSEKVKGVYHCTAETESRKDFNLLVSFESCVS